MKTCKAGLTKLLWELASLGIYHKCVCMHISVHRSDPICVHVYLRLAQYSLLALLVPALSSHTSHLFFETGNVSLSSVHPHLC